MSRAGRALTSFWPISRSLTSNPFGRLSRPFGHIDPLRQLRRFALETQTMPNSLLLADQWPEIEPSFDQVTLEWFDLLRQIKADIDNEESR
jgi:hypothetical protein